MATGIDAHTPNEGCDRLLNVGNCITRDGTGISMKKFLAASALFTGLAASSAYATPLPAAYVNGPLGLGFGPQNYTTCGAGNGQGGVTYHCSVSEDSSYVNGDMTISMSSSNDGQYVGIPFSVTGLFYFQVTGPVGPTSIPIKFTTSATTSAGSDSFAFAGVTIAPIGLTPPFFGTATFSAASCDAASILYGTYCRGQGAYPTSFGGTYDFTVQPNSVGYVQIDINLLALSTASAFIDPMISIDPTWLLDNPGYSLSFSTNSGGVSTAPVPEPVSLSLFSAGLGGLAFLRRKRKKNA